jgi:hypothetical protein
MRDVMTRAAAGAEMDRQTLVAAIASNTALSQADANELAARIEARGSQLGTQAAAAAETTGKAMWGVFGALALGLIACVLGALLGVSRSARRRTVVMEEPTRPVVPATVV